MNAQPWTRYVRPLIAAIASCLVMLWAPIALAQSSAPFLADSTSTREPTESPSAPKAQPSPEKAEDTAQDASRSSPSPQSRRGKTYERAPNPYDMDAIEAYDEEIYGAGR